MGVGATECRQLLKLGEDGVDILSVLTWIETRHHGHFDVVVVAAEVSAMPTQHVELAFEFGPGEEVAGLGVLCQGSERSRDGRRGRAAESLVQIKCAWAHRAKNTRL